MYGLHSSSNFQVLQSFYYTFGDCTERANCNWYHSQFHVPFFFSVLKQGLGTYFSSHFLWLVLSLSQLFYFFLRFFSHQRWLMVFHWSLRDTKSPQVTMTLLSVLADLNNTVVWIVSARPPISNFCRLFIKLLGDRSAHTNYNWSHCHLHVQWL